MAQGETRPRGVRFLTRNERAVLCAFAFVATAAYASSFALHPRAMELLPVATGIGIASGLSWFVLGKVLVILSRRNSRAVMAWFDTCLVAMTVGEMLLLVAAAINFFHWLRPEAGVQPAIGVHLTLLVVADLVMAAIFVTRARWFGIPVWKSAALWVGVLNGAFALLLALLAVPLGYA